MAAVSRPIVGLVRAWLRLSTAIRGGTRGSGETRLARTAAADDDDAFRLFTFQSWLPLRRIASRLGRGQRAGWLAGWQADGRTDDRRYARSLRGSPFRPPHPHPHPHPVSRLPSVAHGPRLELAVVVA